MMSRLSRDLAIVHDSRNRAGSGLVEGKRSICSEQSLYDPRTRIHVRRKRNVALQAGTFVSSALTSLRSANPPPQLVDVIRAYK